MKKNVIGRSLLTVFLASYLFSCSDDTNEIAQETAPTIPPVATFAMDLSAFPTADNPDNGRTAAFKLNYAHAALNFGFWHAVTTVQLVVPVAAFRESFNHEAEYLANEQRWRWKYQVPVGQDNYEAKLYAKLSDSDLKWEMHLSKEGVYEDFKWYTGTSKFDGTGGSWTVSIDPEGSPRAALQIEWKKEGEHVAELQYTSIDQSNEYVDSYIKVGKSESDDFDTYYQVYNSKEENLLKVEFNTETKVGRVADAERFKDEAWHCWNASLEDTVCE